MSLIKYQEQNEAISVMGMVVGTIIALISSLSFTALVALLQLKGYLSENTVGYLCSIIVFFSLLFGNIFGVRKGEGKYILGCVVITAAYMLIMLCVNIIVFEGQFAGVGITAITAILATISACAVLMRPKKKHVKIKNRLR